MQVFRRLAMVILVASSLAACAHGISPFSGPGVTTVHHAGFDLSRGCVMRDVAAPDPQTGGWTPVRERFCGGRTEIAE